MYEEQNNSFSKAGFPPDRRSRIVFDPLNTLRHAGLIQLLLLIEHLYLSGLWLVVDLRTDTKMICL